MKPRVYICGASDCFTDVDYPGQSWTEHLQVAMPDHDIVNLAIEGASNFVIHLQVDRAIEEQADYVIVHFTSSVRQEIRIANTDDDRPLLDRFYRHHLSQPNPTLLTLSFFQSHNSPALARQQQQKLKEFQLEFFDLDIAIKKNYYIIQNALDALVRHGQPFLFSQGGFEHPDFTEDKNLKYQTAFDAYNAWRSKINLWDYLKDFRATTHNVHRPLSRPWFHITNDQDIAGIVQYYRNWIDGHANI